MKKMISKFTVQIFFLLILTSASAQETVATDPDPIRQKFSLLARAWMDAYNSKDAHNLMPLYTEDAKYISGHVEGLQLDGLSKIIWNFQKGINGGGHIDDIEVLSVIQSGEMASVLCRYQATNSGVTVSGRNLLVMKTVNGKWLIAIHMTVV